MRRRTLYLGGIVVLLLLSLSAIVTMAYAEDYDIAVSPLLPGEEMELAGPLATGTVTVINKTKVCIESELDHMDSTEVQIRPNQKAVYKKIPRGRHNLEVSECNHRWEKEKNINLKKAFTWVVK